MSGSIEFPPRTIFCNPNDEFTIRKNIKAEDILILTSTFIPRNRFVASKDIVVETGLIETGYDTHDFISNKFTVVYGTVFY